MRIISEETIQNYRWNKWVEFFWTWGPRVALGMVICMGLWAWLHPLKSRAPFAAVKAVLVVCVVFANVGSWGYKWFVKKFWRKVSAEDFLVLERWERFSGGRPLTEFPTTKEKVEEERACAVAEAEARARAANEAYEEVVDLSGKPDKVGENYQARKYFGQRIRYLTEFLKLVGDGDDGIGILAGPEWNDAFTLRNRIYKEDFAAFGEMEEERLGEQA